jgi:hypothetical protein
LGALVRVRRGSSVEFMHLNMHPLQQRFFAAEAWSQCRRASALGRAAECAACNGVGGYSHQP